MIFAPVIRRAAYAQAPRPADLALQRFLLGTVAESAASRSAGCTVTQDDKATTLQLDVPGLTREQLQIRIEGNVVRLHSVEGAPRRVQRAWELASDIDAAQSTAKLENGVLTLSLAKLAPEDKSVQLLVQ
ncbi:MULTISPECIES: Hsp20/alpha crystallin family protein [unclassified Acidovorax]|uniref:Hsp20/alpha crystallin family protein n=1 Tax=unclassified Acidovorax TaxID=2684926 RepID=UPI00023FD3E1|nr:Hsp20/alpha crystallin family protein [Acidovorax sp. NO-1]EHL21764.1 heat shock protein Hsp20 [Acidovorax sp. NO-1]